MMIVMMSFIIKSLLHHIFTYNGICARFLTKITCLQSLKRIMSFMFGCGEEGLQPVQTLEDFIGSI